MTATLESFHSEQGPFDPETGTYPTIEVVDWTGPGHVRPTSATARVVESGGQAITLRTYDVWVPLDAVLPGEGDAAALRVSASADPRLVGVPLTVLDQPFDDWQTARKVVCQTAA